jgi:hypothetical protein
VNYETWNNFIWTQIIWNFTFYYINSRVEWFDVTIAEFILEDGFPSKTGNSCDGFPSGISMKRKPSDG